MTLQFGKTAGRMMFVFGLANIVGTLYSAVRNPDLLVPGLVVGAVWTAVGWYRGVPLFRTSCDRNEGLQEIRRRRLAFLISLPVVFVLMPFVMMRVPERFRMTSFMLVALTAAVPFLALALSECPHCHEHIAAGKRRHYALLPFRRCVHCGQPL